MTRFSMRRTSTSGSQHRQPVTTLAVSAVALAGLTLAPAGADAAWQEIDNFEDPAYTVGGAVEGNNGWQLNSDPTKSGGSYSEDGPLQKIVEDPTDSGHQVLHLEVQASGESAAPATGIYRDLDPSQHVGEDASDNDSEWTKATLFTRMYVPQAGSSSYNHMYGLDKAGDEVWGDARTGVDDGPVLWDVNGTSASINTDTWYNIWQVMDTSGGDNALKTVYSEVGGSQQTLSDLASGGFSSDSLQRMMVTGKDSEEGFNTTVLYDDFFITEGEDLSVVPSPGALPAGLALLGGMAMIRRRRRA